MKPPTLRHIHTSKVPPPTMKLSELVIITAGLCTIHASEANMSMVQRRKLFEKKDEAHPLVKPSPLKSSEIGKWEKVVTKTPKEIEDEKMNKKALEDKENAGSSDKDESPVAEEPRKSVLEHAKKLGPALGNALTGAGRHGITLPRLEQTAAVNPMAHEPQPATVSTRVSRPKGPNGRNLPTISTEKVTEPKIASPAHGTEEKPKAPQKEDEADSEPLLVNNFNACTSIVSDPVVGVSPPHSPTVTNEKPDSPRTDERIKAQKTDDAFEIEEPKDLVAEQITEVIKSKEKNPEMSEAAASEDDFEKVTEDFANDHASAEVTAEEDGMESAPTSKAQQEVPVPIETKQVDEQPASKDAAVHEKPVDLACFGKIANDVNQNATIFTSAERAKLGEEVTADQVQVECRAEGKTDAIQVPKADLNQSDIPIASETNNVAHESTDDDKANKESEEEEANSDKILQAAEPIEVINSGSYFTGNESYEENANDQTAVGQGNVHSLTDGEQSIDQSLVAGKPKTEEIPFDVEPNNGDTLVAHDIQSQSSNEDPEPATRQVRFVSESAVPLIVPIDTSVAPNETITDRPVETNIGTPEELVVPVTPVDIKAPTILKPQIEKFSGLPLSAPITKPEKQSPSQNAITRGRSHSMRQSRPAPTHTKTDPRPAPHPVVLAKSPEASKASDISASSHGEHRSSDSETDRSNSKKPESGSESSSSDDLEPSKSSSSSSSDLRSGESYSNPETPVGPEEKDPETPVEPEEKTPSLTGAIPEHAVTIVTSSTTQPTPVPSALTNPVQPIYEKRSYLLWALVGLSLFFAVVSPLTYYFFIFRPRIIASSILPDFPVKP